MADVAPRILVVEDDAAVRDGVVGALVDEGYRVRAEPDGLKIAKVARDFDLDLAVLDVRLGVGPSGLSMARVIRDASDAPIIFLSAADEVEDRLAGLRAGADDYLAKPFSMDELMLRVRALLRRSGRLDADAIRVGDLVVDDAGRTATRADTNLELTKVEFDVLLVMARHPGRVLSKTRLLSDVWGFDGYDVNLVEVAMSGLRRKLERKGPRLIHTVRGVGYVLRS